MNSESTISRVATVWVPVSAMNQAVEFYNGKLGLEIEQQEEDWSQLAIDGLTIGLNRRESTSGDGGAVPAFGVSGRLEDVVDHLREQGVEFTGEISDHPWGRIAPFKDPDGNDLQLYSAPE